jgi:hypothetical protein
VEVLAVVVKRSGGLTTFGLLLIDDKLSIDVVCNSGLTL